MQCRQRRRPARAAAGEGACLVDEACCEGVARACRVHHLDVKHGHKACRWEGGGCSRQCCCCCLESIKTGTTQPAGYTPLQRQPRQCGTLHATPPPPPPSRTRAHTPAPTTGLPLGRCLEAIGGAVAAGGHQHTLGHGHQLGHLQQRVQRLLTPTCGAAPACTVPPPQRRRVHPQPAAGGAPSRDLAAPARSACRTGTPDRHLRS